MQRDMTANQRCKYYAGFFQEGTKRNNQMVLNTLWSIILVIVAIIIIVLFLKFLFAIFMIAPTGLHEGIQSLNFVISDLKLSS
jgi:hypothetical protein